MPYIQNKLIYYIELLHKSFSCDITDKISDFQTNLTVENTIAFRNLEIYFYLHKRKRKRKKEKERVQNLKYNNISRVVYVLERDICCTEVKINILTYVRVKQQFPKCQLNFMYNFSNKYIIIILCTYILEKKTQYNNL